MSEDGAHEGWSAPLFPDGAIGSGHEAGGVLVHHGSDGTFRWAEPEVRPDAEVTGWVGACECGWRGEVVTRVLDPGQADTGRRRAFSSDAHLDPEVEDCLVWPQWKAHTAPPDTVAHVAEAARRHLQDGQELQRAVAAARVVGASWADIGRAAGISRQSAHERWARRI